MNSWNKKRIHIRFAKQIVIFRKRGIHNDFAKKIVGSSRIREKDCWCKANLRNREFKVKFKVLTICFDYLFCEFIIDTQSFSWFHLESIIFIAKSLWKHDLFREFTMNLLSFSRSHYKHDLFFDFTLNSRFRRFALHQQSFSRIRLEPTICIWIYYLFREFTLNTQHYFYREFTLNTQSVSRI